MLRRSACASSYTSSRELTPYREAALLTSTSPSSDSIARESIETFNLGSRSPIHCPRNRAEDRSDVERVWRGIVGSSRRGSIGRGGLDCATRYFAFHSVQVAFNTSVTMGCSRSFHLRAFSSQNDQNSTALVAIAIVSCVSGAQCDAATCIVAATMTADP